MSDEPEEGDGYKDKLIKTKQAWAKRGRLITGRTDRDKVERLPPGQRLVTNWPVLDMGIQPQIDKAQWQIEISGLVENPVQWSWQAFMDQPQEAFLTDIHCVTQWSRYDNRWDGVSAAHILELVRPRTEANFIIFHSYDGYTTNIKRSVFEEPDVLLAHSWEGKPLTTEHGAPVRVLIPGWYLWKSAKWIRKIEFVAEDAGGFWEVRGYHNEGDPWLEERYSSSEAPEETFPVPDFKED
jgi:DMSO/TMAO reductase YedYZ molybdopterin-dependent catalytic subunit